MGPDSQWNTTLISGDVRDATPRETPFGRFLLIMLILAGAGGAALTSLLGILTWWESALIAVTFVTLIGGASWTVHILRKLGRGARQGE